MTTQPIPHPERPPRRHGADRPRDYQSASFRKGSAIRYVMNTVNRTRSATAAPAPITMPVFCCRGGDRQASAMTTALSPDRMMLIADDLRQRDEKAHVQGHDSFFFRDAP